MKLPLLFTFMSIPLCLCEDNVAKEIISKLGHVERLRHPVLKTPFTLANQNKKSSAQDPSGLTTKNIQVISEEQPAIVMDLSKPDKQ